MPRVAAIGAGLFGHSWAIVYARSRCIAIGTQLLDHLTNGTSHLTPSGLGSAR